MCGGDDQIVRGSQPILEKKAKKIVHAAAPARGRASRSATT